MEEVLKRSFSEIKSGLIHNEEKRRIVCAVCGKSFFDGEIFRVGERFYDSATAAALHVSEHGGMLEVLLSGDGTGLTDHQKNLLEMVREGLTDAEIAARIGSSPSTVRHQRFVFREKAKQAKLYLAAYELAFEGQGSENLVEVHGGAKMVDERFILTAEENERILKGAFSSFDPLKLIRFPVKEKKKIAILRKIMELFARGRTYTEREINAALEAVYPDFATIRRYLIEYGFMDRKPDCSAYWVKD